jgi:hypothetical protein
MQLCGTQHRAAVNTRQCMHSSHHEPQKDDKHHQHNTQPTLSSTDSAYKVLPGFLHTTFSLRTARADKVAIQVDT